MPLECFIRYAVPFVAVIFLHVIQTVIKAGANKNYFENDVSAPAGRILHDGCTVYKASKEYMVPPPTL
jgi:hypothetical protein